MDRTVARDYCIGRRWYRVGKFHTLATTRSVCAGMQDFRTFLNEGFTGGIGFFSVNILIGNLYLTLLFFLGIISSIVEENAYALWTESRERGHMKHAKRNFLVGLKQIHLLSYHFHQSGMRSLGRFHNDTHQVVNPAFGLRTLVADRLFWLGMGRGGSGSGGRQAVGLL